MSEQRDPFNGVNAVGIRAPDEFMPAVGPPDELGITELPDDLAGMAPRNQIFKFHTTSPYGRGLDIGGPP